MRENPKIMPGSTQPSVPARQQRVVLTGPNQRRGVANRVGRSSCSRTTARGSGHGSRRAIEISLDTMPQMPTAIAYGVTCRPPAGEEVLVLLLADVDATAAAADEHARSAARRRADPRRATLRAPR